MNQDLERIIRELSGLQRGLRNRAEESEAKGLYRDECLQCVHTLDGAIRKIEQEIMSREAMRRLKKDTSQDKCELSVQVGGKAYNAVIGEDE